MKKRPFPDEEQKENNSDSKERKTAEQDITEVRSAEDLIRLVEENPFDHDLRGKLGEFYFKLGKTPHIIEQLLKATEYDPTNYTYLQHLGRAYLDIDEYENSIVYLLKAAEISSSITNTNLETFYHLGKAYFYNGDYQKAIDNLIKGIKDDYTFYLLGQAYLEVDKPQKAIEAFAEIVNSYLDERPQVFYYLGSAYLDSDKTQEAIEAFNQAISLGFDDSNLFYDFGRAYKNLKQYPQAICAINKAIAAMPDNQDYYERLGDILMESMVDQSGDFKVLESALLSYIQGGVAGYAKIIKYYHSCNEDNYFFPDLWAVIKPNIKDHLTKMVLPALQEAAAQAFINENPVWVLLLTEKILEIEGVGILDEYVVAQTSVNALKREKKAYTEKDIQSLKNKDEEYSSKIKELLPPYSEALQESLISNNLLISDTYKVILSFLSPSEVIPDNQTPTTGNTEDNPADS